MIIFTKKAMTCPRSRVIFQLLPQDIEGRVDFISADGDGGLIGDKRLSVQLPKTFKVKGLTLDRITTCPISRSKWQLETVRYK